MLSSAILATMAPSDSLSSPPKFQFYLYIRWFPVSQDPTGPPQLPWSTIRPFRCPYAGGFFGFALPGSSCRPWPSPQTSRLGSPLLPFRGQCLRRGSIHFMLRTGRLLGRFTTFVTSPQNWSYPQPWRSATGPPGSYPDGTFTRKWSRPYLGTHVRRRTNPRQQVARRARTGPEPCACC